MNNDNMNPAKLYAGAFGAVYVLVGLLGFTVSTNMDSHPLFGLFDVNILHNIVHLAIGFIGLAAFAGGVSASRTFAVGLAIVYTVVAVAGFASQPFLGIIPLGGADIALHLASALVGLGAYALSGQTGTRRAV